VYTESRGLTNQRLHHGGAPYIWGGKEGGSVAPVERKGRGLLAYRRT